MAHTISIYTLSTNTILRKEINIMAQETYTSEQVCEIERMAYHRGYDAGVAEGYAAYDAGEVAGYAAGIKERRGKERGETRRNLST